MPNLILSTTWVFFLHLPSHGGFQTAVFAFPPSPVNVEVNLSQSQWNMAKCSENTLLGHFCPETFRLEKDPCVGRLRQNPNVGKIWVGRKVPERACFPNFSLGLAMTPQKPTARDETIVSDLLRDQILKATQLRNILHFEGFLKLKPQADFGIKEITDVLFINDHYFVLDGPGQQLLKFDPTGKFVKAIGHTGRGPGEFERPKLLIRAFDIHFVLIDRQGVMLYDGDGNFVMRPAGFSENGLYIGFNPLIWPQADRILFSDPFPETLNYQHFGWATLVGDRVSRKGGFGEKKKGGLDSLNLPWKAFAQVGDHVWTGSSFDTALEIYDFNGALISDLQDARHPKGVTPEYLKTLYNSKDFQAIRLKDRKYQNWGLHPLGPLVIRTLMPAVGPPVYDIFDQKGTLLARSLKSGTNAIEILDTHGNQLIGKILGAEYVDFSSEHFRKLLYQREVEALQQAGFTEDEEDSYYLWLARLPE